MSVHTEADSFRGLDIAGYVNKVRKLYQGGQTTEHSFRPALAELFSSINPAITVINEPKRKTDVGAPDFVFMRKDVAAGWCEAKDLGKDVRRFAANDYSKEQKVRYTKGLPNLIYTNGFDFEFIRKGESIAFVTVADLIPTLPARPQEFAALEALLRDFVNQSPISINSARHLAEMMAGKAAIIKDIMARALIADTQAGINSELVGQHEAFKASLLHDITVAEFADIYAETIAYGLFAARLHDSSVETFSRQEALDLLPKSNPFLRSLFGYIAGIELDDRLRWVIDELCDVFRATDLHDILKDFGKFTGRNDPFLHFYETFLSEYNPAKRKARGVWYTPEPVVNFIVRAVDEVLVKEFGLADGLADTSKVTIDWDTGQNDPKTGNPATIRKDVHRVQVLDPATGTGTFLAEAIKLVANRVKNVAPGQWSAYVENDLIPRLHGFELLMASYAMCHMKLDMILGELGYIPSASSPRLGVYLTNSLDDGERVEQSLPFMGLQRAIAEESKLANNLKRQTPIMCVIGNPPYSGESANKGAWISGLMEAYKKEPGGIQKLQERNPKWINDDYVKFIRLAEHMIAKNGEGVLGFITNHGYLDNPTFRGMRWQLMESFDQIYVLDLHGNSKKKEVCPDGSPDKNVFDIMQGVAIIVAVKRRHTDKAAKPLAKVWHGDLWGSRGFKNIKLWDSNMSALAATALPPKAPQYPFVARNYGVEDVYSKGFSIAELFDVGGTGIVTKRDRLTIHYTPDGVWQAVQDFLNLSEAIVRKKYRLPEDVRDWRYDWALRDIQKAPSFTKIKKITYRPFDFRYIYFTGQSRGFVGWPVEKIMRNFHLGSNFGLCTARSNKNPEVDHFYMTENAMETKCAESSTQSAVFPLYLYPEEGTLDQTIRVNFNPALYAKIREAAGLSGPSPAPDGSDDFRRATGAARPDEVKVFDYIYAVLHCPAYRETYAQFLKIDFPRIPYPANPETFTALSEQGEALRRLHLMEADAVGETPFPFQGDGNSVVNKPRFEPGLQTGKVWINDEQYFEGVPAQAWEHHIGGYQPAQKWLKDRKGRKLDWQDIRHYQSIIKILSETGRIMGKIDMPAT